MASKRWCFTLNNPGQGDTHFPELCKYLIIGNEVGDSETPHWQGYATFNKPMSMIQLKKLNHRIHWEKAKGTPYQNKVYCSKDGDFQEYGVIPNAPGPSHKKQTKDPYHKVLAADNAQDAIERVKAKRPRDYALHGEAIERNLKRHKPMSFSSKHSMDDFLRGPLPLNLPTLLYGPSNTGKTQFALAHFQKPLLVSHIDDLKMFNNHDGIVFDDISFLHWPPTSVIHLLDQDCPRSINVKYGTTVIPANTKKIFTFNLPNPFYTEQCPEYQQDAINRRYEGVNIINKLY